MNKAVLTCTIWAVVAWKDHLGMPSARVPLQLALGGEELPTELTDEGAVCRCEVLAGAMALQVPREEKVMEQYRQQNGREPVGEALFESGLGQPG